VYSMPKLYSRRENWSQLIILQYPLNIFAFKCRSGAEIPERSNQIYHYVKPSQLVLKWKGVSWECTSPVAHSQTLRMKLHRGHSTYGFITIFQTAKSSLLSQNLSSKLALWLQFGFSRAQLPGHRLPNSAASPFWSCDVISGVSISWP